MHWLLGRKSQLSTTNKLLLYKTVLKPICTYGIQLWGTASTSNVEILERFQSKVLRMIVDAPWYVPTSLIRRDLQSKTKSAVTALTTVIDFAPIPIIDAFAGFCLMICLTDSNELLLTVNNNTFSFATIDKVFIK
jgi:hypothetical protein